MNNLDSQFWTLILANWTMMEIDNLAGYAADVERNTTW